MPVLVQLQHRFDTAANWAAANPVLLTGEWGLDTTNGRVKLGNGAAAWNSLPYHATRILATSGVPAAGVGVDGDYAIDKTNMVLYGPKAGGSWTGTGTTMQGPQGIQGTPGSPGANGQGVPTGGTAGQFLKKQSATSYDTGWFTPAITELANIAASTILGNNSGGSGPITALTPTQVTAMLNTATTALKGLQSAADKRKQDGLHYDVVAQGGADPTGAVDATAIIQAAIDSVGAAGGGVVYFPLGTYRVSANININHPYVTLRGASRVKTLIKSWVATGNVFTAVAGAHFARWETMRIEGGDGVTGTLRTAGYAIEAAAGANNCSCQWIDILFHWSGVKASGQLFRLEDMNIREMGMHATGGCGILNDTFTDQYIKSVVMDNPVPPWGNAPGGPVGFSGVRITNLSSLLMADCQIIHCGKGIDLLPAGTNTVPSIYCINSFFDNCVIGGNFVPGTGSIFRCRFVGCWFSSNTQAGVVLNGTNINGLDFIGCEFYGNPVGIDAQNATEWSVRSSRIAGNTANGIKTTAAAAHSFSITDNVIGNVSGFGANAQGVNVQAGTYKRYQILDNRGFESNTTPGIIDLGVVAATDQKNVGNNMGALLKGAIATLGAALTVPVTTETVVLNVRVPANAVSVGQVFRIRAIGVTAGANVPTWRVKAGTAGTTADAEKFLLASAAGVANGRAGCEFYVTIRSIGAAGTMVVDGLVHNNSAVLGKVAALATAAIDTTQPWFLDLTLAQTVGAMAMATAVIEAL